MTILPKKKNKEKAGVALLPQQQTPPEGSGDSGSEEEQQEGAAGGHTPPLEGESLSGYTHYTSSPGNYYERHYSSGDSSPELPVLSKVRYRGSSAQKKVDSALPIPGSPTYSGYNSGEEYDGSVVYFDAEKERLFEDTLKRERGFVIKRMRSDGACLFRSVADQVYGDQDMHSVVRNNCMDYMLKNSEYFSQFVTEDFEHYVNRKRADRSYGNYLEMQAIAEMYNRCIEVYQYSTDPINIFFGVYKTDNAPIRLSYHGGVHYNSVVDPHNATIGVGLGLAGHKPGTADKSLVSKAKKESELVFIEQCMLEDKMLHSDWDNTCEAVEQAVARESYLLWLRQQEGDTKGSVGESSRLPQSLPPSQGSGSAPVSLQPLSSSIPSALTTPTTSLTTPTINTSSVKNPLRARSRSRSSPRSQSPLTPPTGRRSPKGGRGSSSPRRSSPLRSSPEGLPRTSPLTSRQVSPSYHSPSPPGGSRPPSCEGSPRSSPVFTRLPPTRSSPRPLVTRPALLTGTNSTPANNKSHDISSIPPPPGSCLDYESGGVLSQVPYEYSSFINLPPSAFGLVSWETEDDPELVAVLAASQQEYFDGLKRSNNEGDGAGNL